MGETKVQEIESKIFEQKREILVKIPAIIREKFRINPEKDKFVWVITEEGDSISLSGLLKKDIKKDDKTI